MSDMSSDPTGDPTRLVDLDGGSFSSMGSDLRAARSSGSTYDVDAGLLRFSALVAAAPVAAVIGTSAAAQAAPAGAGAVAPGAIGAGGTAAATSAVASSAATSAAVTSAATAAGTSAGAAAKIAVAAKLGFGMKTVAAAVIATGAIGVAGYEVASSPSSREQPSWHVAGDDRMRTTDVSPRAPAPLEAPRHDSRWADPREVSAPADRPSVEAPPVARPSGRPAAGQPASGQPSGPDEPRLEPPSTTTPSSPVPSPTGSEPTTILAPTDLAPTANGSANGSVTSSVKPEMEQLARVRAAGDPSRQVTLAEEGHRLFPRGVFFQEREAIAIDALSRAGRTGEAAERARLYVARYPKSPYVETFRRIAER